MASIRMTSVFLMAYVAVVHSATLEYKPEHWKHGEEAEDLKTYLFAGDGKKVPYNYINKFGVLEGFDVDIVREVCAVAGKKCKTVMAEFQECAFTYKNMDYGGVGISSGWFDGCPGYQITTDRLNTFDFTLPYLQGQATFTVAPGNPKKFNPQDSDFTQFKILHLSGAPTNTQCLTRLRKTFNENSILVANDLPEARTALLNGTADVLFSPRMKIDGLEVLPDLMHCDTTGAGIMLRKGSDLATWWDPAFKQYYQSGAYEALCKNAQEKYGAPANCFPPPEEASQELLEVMNKPTPKLPGRLWKFVVSGSVEPFSYLNTEGELVGFTKDMIQEVCRRAGQTCVLTLAKVSECTKRLDERLFPQRGIMENWFDGCTGYFSTEERRNSWDFTGPYLVSNATFKVAPGNPLGFDPTSDDFSQYTIVRDATAITNDHCLNRLHKKFDRFLVVDTSDQAVEAVLSGKADVMFTKQKNITALDTLEPVFHCEHVGTSIMLKKGSEVPFWWNRAFGDFYESGEFNQFCLDQGQKHGGFNFPCLPPPSHPEHKYFLEAFEGF